MARYIFITGAWSPPSARSRIGGARRFAAGAGYKVRLRQLARTLNVDPGTIRPIITARCRHRDGADTDLDLGHYERFTCARQSPGQHPRPGASTRRSSPRSAAALPGRDHPGGPARHQCHQDFIREGNEGYDFVPEIGGTVCDIEGCRSSGHSPVRQRPAASSGDLHPLTLLPFITGAASSRPSRRPSVTELRSIGIHPYILLCRTDRPTPRKMRRKLVCFCTCAKRRDRGTRRRQIYAGA